MNLLLLLIALRPWNRSPLHALLRILAAIALLSIELQLVTWLGVGSLRTLPVVNALLAATAMLPRFRRADRPESPRAVHADPQPWVAIALLAGTVLTLSLVRPLEGADPYHLERVDQIVRTGTLEYDPSAHVKVNVLTMVYEPALADLRQTPMVGDTLLRLHGVFGLALYALCIAALRTYLPQGPPWSWSALFAVPVVFHQFVYVKNDLFGAIPSLLALGWLTVRAPRAPLGEIFWASMLVGFAVAMKLTSFPLALVAVAVIAYDRRDDWRPMLALMAGGALGSMAGGLPFTLVQTYRWYDGPMAPLAELGNRHATVPDAAIGIARFGISLFDLGLLTRAWWPGRGGWGTTFGVPLIWALAVLLLFRHRMPEARRALGIAGVCFLTFAAVYPDADIAHRLTLAPGLLLIAVAVHAVGSDQRSDVCLRRALGVVLLVSGLQIARSAVLYFVQR